MGSTRWVPLGLDPTLWILWQFAGPLRPVPILHLCDICQITIEKLCPAFWQELWKESHTAVIMVHISAVRNIGFLTSNQLAKRAIFPSSVDWGSQDTNVQHKACFMEPSALAWRAEVCSYATLVLLQSRYILFLMSIKYTVLSPCTIL